MKKQFVRNSTRKMVRFGAILLLVAGSFSQSLARPVAKGDDPFVNIQYVGAAAERVQFQFDLVADNDETYLLTIQDEDGTVLYKEKVAKKIFTKKYEWNNADQNTTKLLFTVTGERSKKTQVFEVNTTVRTVQDVVITKR